MPSKPDCFFAILSDIHADIDALTAVLSDIDQFPVKGMFCLGDIVGYGPEPASCVQRIMDTCAVTVLGNHEAMLLIADEIPDEDWDISIRQPIHLANEQLTKAQKSWLRSNPITADLDPITLSHASLHKALECRCLKPAEKPVRLDPGQRYSINVGSVGQPRDDDPRASYMLYDYEQHLLLHRRVSYDIARAQSRFKKAGLPAHNAKRITKGQ
jgi:diadenosine tetraphosphatase ApaH/serine/threonine PP2A family protein phosphatase